MLVYVFRANVPIFVEGDEIECAEGVKGSELHLRDVVKTFEPCRKADSGERRVVQSGLEVVDFHGCGRHVGRRSVFGDTVGER